MGRYIKVDSQKEFEFLEQMRKAERMKWVEDILAAVCLLAILFVIGLYGLAFS